MRTLVVWLLIVLPATAADPEVATVLVFGSAGRGSGAVIEAKAGESLVLTNRHVCPEKYACHVRAAGKTYAAEWLGCSADCDVALLRVKVELPCAPLADKEPARGSQVRLFGYGGLAKAGELYGPDGSHYPTIGDGYFVGFRSEPGDSGAPLIDADGKVVGLIRGNQGSTGPGMAVRLSEVRSCLHQLRPRP